jgi:hypothetical protein
MGLSLSPGEKVMGLALSLGENGLSPLPWGEGVPLPALSSAGAGRVRGFFR